MSKLKDTIDMMLSDDYADRLVAEYLQLKIRVNKLQKICDCYNDLDFLPKCSHMTLYRQLKYMKKYLRMLEKRLLIENIKVGEYDRTLRN